MLKDDNNKYASEISLRRTPTRTRRLKDSPSKLNSKTIQSNRITSPYRGVTHHCRTGRFEAHIWDSGKQVYLGGFESEQKAALAYDVACVRFRGADAQTNFDIQGYAFELAHLNKISKEEVVLNLRRQSKGNQHNSSKYRGVTLHQKGKWEARIGTLVGRKYKYLGLFTKEEDAASAYDRESVRQKGLRAVTNFDICNYLDLLNKEDLNVLRIQGKVSEFGTPVCISPMTKLLDVSRSNSFASMPTSENVFGVLNDQGNKSLTDFRCLSTSERLMHQEKSMKKCIPHNASLNVSVYNQDSSIHYDQNMPHLVCCEKCTDKFCTFCSERQCGTACSDVPDDAYLGLGLYDNYNYTYEDKVAASAYLSILQDIPDSCDQFKNLENAARGVVESNTHSPCSSLKVYPHDTNLTDGLKSEMKPTSLENMDDPILDLSWLDKEKHSPTLRPQFKDKVKCADASSINEECGSAYNLCNDYEEVTLFESTTAHRITLDDAKIIFRQKAN